MTVIGVSQILSEKFNLDARPGQKVVCPFCGHKTFFVKGDDSIGKCFHPDCGRFISPSQFDKQYKKSLHSVLEAIFYDFHQALMDLRDVNHYPHALTYLINKRGFHAKVIQDSMMGCVPSGGYDLEAKFRPLIEELEAAVVAEGKNEKKSKGKKPTFTSEQRLKFVQEAKEKLARCLEHRAGWLCFFYTDASHRITSIKFRKPYSKIFVFFKPFKYAGVFGAMFQPGERQKQVDYCLFVEGECNLLALQSLALRYAEFLEIETDYVPCFAVGGAQSADFETVKKLSKHPVLILDNDKAGFGMLDQARQVMTVEALTTPKPDSDLDSYIAEFGQDYQGAYTSIQKLVAERQLYPRYYESVAAEVRVARDTDAKTHIINDMVAAIIRGDLKDRGKFYNDGQMAYFFFINEKKLISVDQDDKEFILLLNRYSVNKADHIFKYITEALWFESFEHGTKTTVYNLSYFDSNIYTLYIFNLENRIFKITPDKIEEVDNGTDGILFLNKKNYKPFQFIEIEKPFYYLNNYLISWINFKDLSSSDNGKGDSLSPFERKLTFRLWLKAIFFESIMPTKPLLGLIGPKGSGKTNIIRKVGILIFGPNFNVTTISKDEKDFDAAISNSSYVAVDNVDGRVKWLNDRLAAVATGQNIIKRKLYTTNQLVEFPVSCFLALSSRSPNFRRDDVADRLLIMYVERLKKFKSEKSLTKELLANRDAIMTELMYELQDAVRALKAEAGKDDSSTFRMADFADFAMKVARHEGKEKALQEIFKKMSREQSEFTLEDDPIFDLLLHWGSVNGNSGRFISNKELCDELTKLAEELKINFPYRGETRSFTNRMTNIRSNLEEFFVINHKPGPQRSNFYSYELKVN